MFAQAGRASETISQELATPDRSRYTLENILSRASQGANLSPPGSFTEGVLWLDAGGATRRHDTCQAQQREPHEDFAHHLGYAPCKRIVWKVKCPVLIVTAGGTGPDDPLEAVFIEMKRKGVAEAEKSLKDVKSVWMPETTDHIPLQRPEELAKELLEFFGASGIMAQTGGLHPCF